MGYIHWNFYERNFIIVTSHELREKWINAVFCPPVILLLHSLPNDNHIISYKTSISANADGLHDTVSCKIDHITLATEYNYQAKSIGRQQIATLPKKCWLLTHLNDNAQTPLGRFAFDILYTQLCNIYSDKNGSHEPNMPLLAVICHALGKTI